MVKLFLIASSLPEQRKIALDSVKKSIPQNLLQSGMVTTLFAGELKLKTLQEDILTFSLAGEKVVVIKDAQDLGKEESAFLADNLEGACAHAYLIFEFDEDMSAITVGAKKNKLLAALLAKATTFKLAEAKPEVAWDDLTSSIRRNDLNSSLYNLEKLLEHEREEKLAPLLIGVFTSRAAYLSDRDKKKKSLQYIFDADRAIKERGQDTRTVLEALITKLLTL